MERFKVVERETKTKAYSKEGMCTYLVPLTSTLAYFYLLPSLSYSFILPLLFIFFPFPLLYLSSHLPIFISLLFFPPLPSCCTFPLLCIYLLLHPNPTLCPLHIPHTYISTLYTSTSHFYTHMSFSTLIY